MSKNVPIERRTNRLLLVFCDGIVIMFVIFLVIGLHISLARPFSAEIIILEIVIGGACLFGARFIFRVYKQIWRYGSIRSFTRFMLAEICGGFVYVLINKMFISEISLLRGLTVLALDFSVCYCMRIAYVYCFTFAKNDTLIGNICRRIVIDFARTDLDGDENEPGAIIPGRLFAPHKDTHHGVPINVIQSVARHFDIKGKIINIEQMTRGYINQTYRVETIDEENNTHYYTLQRINTNVFKDVDALMDNFVLTTEHIRGTFKLPGQTKKGSIQTIKATKTGDKYYRDDSGCWRMMSHFTGVYSLDIPDTPETFYYAGQSFGLFVKCMADIPWPGVKEVIPNFHNTMSRYRDLEKVVEKNPVGRLSEVGEELNYVRKLADSGRLGVITAALESGEIPTRVCHNDCNLNNILFDEKTHLPVAVIDLDTVMPGSPLYDYGDSMRIGTNTAKDDEKDLSKVSCDLNLYEQYARGYLEACGDMLTRRELELLPYSSIVIASEDGIRFLMDHIDGDTYYNIFYAGQNLDRCRTQLALVKDMERKLPQIKEILRKIYKEQGLAADI